MKNVKQNRMAVMPVGMLMLSMGIPMIISMVLQAIRVNNRFHRLISHHATWDRYISLIAKRITPQPVPLLQPSLPSVTKDRQIQRNSDLLHQ